MSKENSIFAIRDLTNSDSNSMVDEAINRAVSSQAKKKKC